MDHKGENMATAKKTTDETVKKAEKKAVSTTTKKVKELVETEAIAEVIVEAEQQLEAEAKAPATAKAGKRSAKALKEDEEKQAKEARKAEAQTDEEVAKPKVAVKPARSRLERRSKSYREKAKLFDASKTYNLAEALKIAQKTNPAKFDASVELHIRLGVDPRQADQNIRGTVVLPGGTGKSVRVAVFADVEDVAKAKKAGADIAAGDEFLQQLDKEVVDFDVLIATPQQMAKLGKYARLLGPKGLMPNPKSGTVTTDVTKAVNEAKGGKVEYRVDSTGIVHVAIGRVSFDADKLRQNAQAVLGALKSAKPASLKNQYVKSIYVTTSMGPSIQIDNNEL